MSTGSQPFSESALLDAFHRSHADLLSRIIEDLDVPPDGVILDMACGDGFYTEWLARRASANAVVIAADLNRECLDRARRRMAAANLATQARFLRADVFDLPLAEGGVDLIWSAQSMITLEDPVAALCEMGRLLAPGGRLAILENNRLHHLMLPWPPSLEIAVERARLAALEHRRPGVSDRDFARASVRMLRAAGLRPLAKRTYACDFIGPLTGDALEFMDRHLRFLGETIEAYIDRETSAQFHELADPASPRYLPVQPDFEMCSLVVVSLARRA